MDIKWDKSWWAPITAWWCLPITREPRKQSWYHCLVCLPKGLCHPCLQINLIQTGCSFFQVPLMGYGQGNLSACYSVFSTNCSFPNWLIFFFFYCFLKESLLLPRSWITHIPWDPLCGHTFDSQSHLSCLMWLPYAFHCIIVKTQCKSLPFKQPNPWWSQFHCLQCDPRLSSYLSGPVSLSAKMAVNNTCLTVL